MLEVRQGSIVCSSLGSIIENTEPALAIHETLVSKQNSNKNKRKSCPLYYLTPYTPRHAEELRDGTEQAHRNPRMQVIYSRQFHIPIPLPFSKTKEDSPLLPRRSPRSNSVPAALPSRAGSEVTAALVVTWFSAFTRKARRSQRAEPASRWRALACLRVVASAPRSRSLSPERRRGWCGTARGPPRAAASDQGQAAGVRGAAGLWGGE